MTEAESRLVFHQHVSALKAKREALASKDRQACVERIQTVLSRLAERGDIQTNTRWRQAVKPMKSSRELREFSQPGADPELVAMFEIDLLDQYETFIRGLESRFWDHADAEKLKTRKRERRARDEFRDVLADQQIYCLTRWSEVYPHLKRKDCYQDLLLQGSAPLDMFFDVIVEMDDVYRRDKAEIKRIIRESRDFSMSKRTTRDEFMRVIKQAEGSIEHRFEPHSADLVFDEVCATLFR